MDTDPQRQQERRHHRRASFSRVVTLPEWGFFQSLNLSLGGMYLEAMVPYIGRKSILEIRFNLYEIEHYFINVQCSVVYNNIPRGIGIRFINLKPKDSEKIKLLIAGNGRS